MRILLDTNIIISSSLLSESPPGKLVQGWLDGRFELVTSQAQLDELLQALGYERLRDRISPEQARDFEERYAAYRSDSTTTFVFANPEQLSDAMALST